MRREGRELSLSSSWWYPLDISKCENTVDPLSSVITSSILRCWVCLRGNCLVCHTHTYVQVNLALILLGSDHWRRYPSRWLVNFFNDILVQKVLYFFFHFLPYAKRLSAWWLCDRLKVRVNFQINLNVCQLPNSFKSIFALFHKFFDVARVLRLFGFLWDCLAYMYHSQVLSILITQRWCGLCISLYELPRDNHFGLRLGERFKASQYGYEVCLIGSAVRLYLASCFCPSLWKHKLMLITLRIRPYVSTLIVILATIMSLFLGHAMCKIWISLYTK